MVVTVLVADEDPVTRLVRAAAQPGSIPAAWLRDYFAPEPGDPESALARVRAAAGLESPMSVVAGTAGTEAELLGLVEEADAIVYRRAAITGAVIGRAPRLRLIQRLGGRAQGVDLAAATRAGVAVSCLPRRTLIFTAEHTILLMLALTKRLVAGHRAVIEGAYDQARVRPIDAVAYNWPGLTGLGGLWGAPLGIVGLGEVGTLVAERARALGMRVSYHQRHRLGPDAESALGVRYATWEELFAEADFVSLHARDLPENAGLIGAREFALMKPGAFFVNTSRGRLCDEVALARALREGRLAGAGLDVHQEEPRRVGDPLAALPNVVLTPHVAGGSRYGLLGEVEEILRNVRAALRGEPVTWAVSG